MKTRLFSIIAVCALLICSCKSTKTTTQSSSPDMTEKSPPTETTRVREFEQMAEVRVSTESVKLVDAPEKTMYRYYVIIGSFRLIEGARTWKADMVRKGFNPEILENESGLFRVSVGGYDDERAARSQIANIRATYKEEHGDVWLLVRK